MAVIELPDTVISAHYEIFPEIIEDLPLKIGKSQTVDGITVTVESARVMADSFVLLVKVEGDNIPDNGKVATDGDGISLTQTQCSARDLRLTSRAMHLKAAVNITDMWVTQRVMITASP